MHLFLIFIAFVALGVYIHNGYKTRKQFFESLLAFCNHLSTEINFSKSSIGSIINTYAPSYHISFRKLLLKYKTSIDAKEDINPHSFSLLTSHFSLRLKQSEKTHIASFFSELGKHGPSEEVAKIQNKKVFFQQFYDGASLHLRRDASMYLKFCIILGIASVILLI